MAKTVFAGFDWDHRAKENRLGDSTSWTTCRIYRLILGFRVLSMQLDLFGALSNIVPIHASSVPELKSWSTTPFMRILVQCAACACRQAITVWEPL